MIEIIETPIDEAAVLQSVKSNEAGAQILFSGTTRRTTADKITDTLSYEAYHAMAIKKLEEIRGLAMDRWPIIQCSIVHRIGTVPVGQTSVVVAVSSPHRVDAFESAAWLMDTLKSEVPIWKKEIYADGQQEWVHPDKPVIDKTALGQ